MLRHIAGPVLSAWLLLLAGCVPAGRPESPHAAPQPLPPRKVELRFVHSPYSDYLFYLMYRNRDEFAALDTLLDLSLVPRVSELISLPEAVASAQIERYADIYPLLEAYRNPSGAVVTEPRPRKLAYNFVVPAYDSIRATVEQGESRFPRFLAFWEREIRPTELANIRAWQAQHEACAPLETLQRLTRLPLRADTLDVGAIALHLSASANYSPAGVYSETFRKPDLAWLLGHEATHLLLSPYLGTDWRRHPLAAEAIRAAEAHGGRDEDIEESLALFMQLTLSQRCGLSDPEERISAGFTRDTPKRRIIIAMEERWPAYLQTSAAGETIIDFMLRSAVAALRR